MRLLFTWSPMLDVDTGSEIPAGQEVTDPSSVETGDEPGAGTASASDQGEQDVTQLPSFATRLREKTSEFEEKHKPQLQAYSQLEGISKTLGFASVDDYLAAVNDQARQRQAEQEAERLGVDPETYNQFFAPVHQDLQNTKQELQRLRQADLERQIRSDYDRLSAQYPDFKEHEQAIWQLATERRLPLEDAYKLVSYDSRIAAARLETEQQVLANVTGRGEKQVLSANDRGAATKLDPSAMSLKDIEAISARVQRGERITF